MRILIINGPNLNLLGEREPNVYGTRSFEEYFGELKSRFPTISFEYFQSNIEGHLIEKIQQANGYNGVVFNPGGYAHTSVALADAIAAIDTSVVEVHVSNVFARESFRHKSFTAAKCCGTITGLGLEGYALAVKYLLSRRQENQARL